MNRPVSHPRRYKRRRKRKSPITIMIVLFCLALLSYVVYAATIAGSDDSSGADGYVFIQPALPVLAEEYVSNQQYLCAQQDYVLDEVYETTNKLTFNQLASMSNDHLLLVNDEYAVPANIASNMVRLSNYVQSLNPDMLLNEDVLNMLRVMFNSAAGEGFTQFRVTQAFRTHEYQQRLYDSMAGTGLAARPGHSEHQVGLAVDISYEGVNIGNSREGSWLMNYSYRYGFIFRYPEHKTDVTRVPFEPWHYRYVGQPHAYFMRQRDFVLEEYIEYLRRNREVVISFSGMTFRVVYLLDADETVEIPEGYTFMTSRDNTGGVIVTIWAR